MRRRAGSPLYVRANSTHSAIATRAGVVPECNTSPTAQRSRARSIRASWTTGYWGAIRSILGVDSVALADHRVDDPAGQLGGVGVALRLGQMALQDGRRGALTEVRLEDRRERQPPPGPPGADPIGAGGIAGAPPLAGFAFGFGVGRSSLKVTLANRAGSPAEGTARRGSFARPGSRARRVLSGPGLVGARDCRTGLICPRSRCLRRRRRSCGRSRQ